MTVKQLMRGDLFDAIMENSTSRFNEDTVRMARLVMVDGWTNKDAETEVLLYARGDLNRRCIRKIERMVRRYENIKRVDNNHGEVVVPELEQLTHDDFEKWVSTHPDIHITGLRRHGGKYVDNCVQLMWMAYQAK